MNKPNVKALLTRLYEVTEFRISIHDVNGHERVAIPETPHAFCRCLQRDPAARKICEASDCEAFHHADETGKLVVYRCPFGLYEAVCPLFRYGEPAGYLMMGQVPAAGESLKEALDRAARHGDRQEMEEALEALPSCSREKIETFSEVLAVFAEYMTLTGAIQSSTGNVTAEVRRYLEAHFTENVTVSALCARFAVSRTALLGSYRAAYGETVKQTLTSLRLQKGRDLVLSTNTTVTKIARQCGYTDGGYFIKSYRKYFGITPAEERKKGK
ncbi:MAG: PocR ligand-binding domain-containing protein [Clostridia bacterium]|nr:PocR ligand-binding domain-containing protein [Clostridia bacterium]